MRHQIWNKSVLVCSFWVANWETLPNAATVEYDGKSREAPGNARPCRFFQYRCRRAKPSPFTTRIKVIYWRDLRMQSRAPCGATQT